MAVSQSTRIELDALQIEKIVIAISAALSADYQNIVAKLDAIMQKEVQIEQEINAPPPVDRVATSVEICIPRFSPKHGGPTLPGTFSCTDDHDAHTTINWKDDVGPVNPPVDAQVVGSDDTVATVALSSDKKDVDTSPVGDGQMTWTVSSPSLNISDTVTVNVTMATATSVSADAAGTTFTPKVPVPGP